MDIPNTTITLPTDFWHDLRLMLGDELERAEAFFEDKGINLEDLSDESHMDSGWSVKDYEVQIANHSVAIQMWDIITAAIKEGTP